MPPLLGGSPTILTFLSFSSAQSSDVKTLHRCFNSFPLSPCSPLNTVWYMGTCVFHFHASPFSPVLVPYKKWLCSSQVQWIQKGNLPSPVTTPFLLLSSLSVNGIHAHLRSPQPPPPKNRAHTCLPPKSASHTDFGFVSAYMPTRPTLPIPRATAVTYRTG